MDWEQGLTAADFMAHAPVVTNNGPQAAVVSLFRCSRRVGPTAGGLYIGYTEGLTGPCLLILQAILRSQEPPILSITGLWLGPKFRTKTQQL